jgi:outer membrane biosynthesis protein TonB
MTRKRSIALFSLALVLMLVGASTMVVMAQEPEQEPAELTYVVQDGDTAESIVGFIFEEYGLSLTAEELLTANGLSSEEELVPDLELVIPQPTDEGTSEPTDEVTVEPTDEVTVEPTDEVTVEPTDEVTVEPTDEVTAEPTDEVTVEPTDEVTAEPTDEATAEPSEEVPAARTEESTVELPAEPAIDSEAAPAQIGAAAINPGVANTTVYLMDTGGSGATVGLDYYAHNSATPTGHKDITLNNYGSRQILASDSDLGLGDGFRGTAIVQSDVKLASAAVTEWANQSRAGAYRGFDVGSQVQYLPFLNYQPNVRDWALAVFNVGDSDTTITLSYYNRDGVKDFTITDTVPRGQQKYYDSAAGGSKIPNWSTSSYFNSNGFWTGGIKISANGADDRIVAVMASHYRNYSAQYGGISSGDSKVYVPYVARRQTAARGKLVASNISIQNLSGSSTTVTTTFIDNQTGATSLVINDTIPAFSLASFNVLVGGATHPRSEFYALDRFQPADSGTDEWVGSAIVESSGAELAVVATTIRQEINVMGQYAAGGQAAGATACFYPAAFRIKNSGFNNNGKFNQIRLQNVMTTDATNVDFRFYNRSGGAGTTIAALTNLTIEGEKSQAYLLKSPDLSVLGTNWVGGIRVTSDQPLLCTSEILNGNIRMASYEATGAP